MVRKKLSHHKQGFVTFSEFLDESKRLKNYIVSDCARVKAINSLEISGHSKLVIIGVSVFTK